MTNRDYQLLRAKAGELVNDILGCRFQATLLNPTLCETPIHYSSVSLAEHLEQLYYEGGDGFRAPDQFEIARAMGEGAADAAISFFKKPHHRTLLREDDGDVPGGGDAVGAGELPGG